MESATTSVIERLRRDVSFLTETVGFRDRNHLVNLQKASQYLQAKFRELTPHIDIQSFVVGGVSYENVIAHFGPTSGEVVIIGAHYDAVSESLGADDNASGVAGLLEVARRLTQVPLDRPVELAAYTLEESAFATDEMGSVRHAQAHAGAGTRVRAMISLEMIGFYSDRDGSQGAPDPRIAEHYPRQGNFLMVVGRPEDAPLTSRMEERMRAASALPVYSINAPRAVPGIDLSDHRNFWDAGFPAAMITDTAFYRNPHYHMPSDVIGTLDFNRMTQAVDGITAVVRDLSRKEATGA
jgi:Zn-dependent M28 family amino/carboxypeptidase